MWTDQELNLGPPSYQGWCTTTVPPVLRYKSVDYNIIPTKGSDT